MHLFPRRTRLLLLRALLLFNLRFFLGKETKCSVHSRVVQKSVLFGKTELDKEKRVLDRNKGQQRVKGSKYMWFDEKKVCTRKSIWSRMIRGSMLIIPWRQIAQPSTPDTFFYYYRFPAQLVSVGFSKKKLDPFPREWRTKAQVLVPVCVFNRIFLFLNPATGGDSLPTHGYLLPSPSPVDQPNLLYLTRNRWIPTSASTGSE
jgi:hypothetical protein